MPPGLLYPRQYDAGGGWRCRPGGSDRDRPGSSGHRAPGSGEKAPGLARNHDIPGGNGARRLVFQDENTVQIIKHAADKAEICMMIGSGVSVLAQSGLLYRRKVADCDIDQNWRRLFMGGVSVVKDAIWVSDGKFYSSSNTMNGIDMALAIVADYMDVDTALYVAKQIGYNWDPNDERAYISCSAKR